MDVTNIAQCNSVHNMVLVNFALDKASQGCVRSCYHAQWAWLASLLSIAAESFLTVSKPVWLGDISWRNMLTKDNLPRLVPIA